MFHFEHRDEPLASHKVYHRRLAKSGAVGFVILVVSLLAGMAGFIFLEEMNALDAFMNASMMLSDQGPLHTPRTTEGKIFASFYALFSGFAVVAIAAIAFAPVIHRVMHRFQGDEDRGQKS
jgi:hypothetical protein